MKRILPLMALVLTTHVAAKPARDSAVEKQSKHTKAKITPPAPMGDPTQWFTSDDYPADALRNGSSGMVNVTLAIDETGKAVDCNVTESSGNQSLDDAACAVMMARARFVPAHDEQGKPVAGTFHRKISWQIPGERREIWTLDQIRFATPKNVQLLAPLAADHNMDAVVKRLKSLGIAFERKVAQLDTIKAPETVIAKINSLPATEPFVIPEVDITTINVITARKPVDLFNGSTAKPFPLQSPLSEQATVSFDVDPDGKSSNCYVKGEAPVWMASITGMCRAMEMLKPTFSPNTTKQNRHVTMTLQVSIKSTELSPPSPPSK